MPARAASAFVRSMWALSGQRLASRTNRAFRAPGCAVPFTRRASTLIIFTLALLLAHVAPALAAEDIPTDPSRFPPWFRHFVSTVRSDSKTAGADADAKLAEAIKSGDLVAEAWARLAVGTAKRIQNDFPGALVESRLALALADALPDDLIKFNAHYIHGLNLSALGDPASAVEHYLHSLRYADARNSAMTRSTALAALAAAYARLGNIDRAVAHETEALALVEKAGNRRAVGMYSNNLGDLQEKLGDLASARRNYELALTIKREEGNRTAITDVEESIVMLDFAEGRAEASLAALAPILAQRRTLRGKIKLSNTLLNRSEVLQKLGRLDEALADAEEARGYIANIDSRNLRASVNKRLAALYEARGDFAAALAVTRLEYTEREAAAGEAAKTRAAALQVQFDVAKKDTELARLARESELRSAEKRVQDAQVARQAAELRATTADLRAREADLDHTRLSRYLLGAGLGTALLAVGALAAFQRYRLRTEHRLLEQTRTARDAAEKADRLKTRFLGVASHDIRAPLGNILNLTESIRTESTLLAHRTELDLVSAEAQRVLGLVEDLLTTATLESGKLELRPAPTDLTEVTHAVVGSLRWQARAKRQAIVFHEPAHEAGLLTADAARLYQVVANLVANAIKFSPADSTITLQLLRSTDLLTLSVRDQGPGLPADDLAKLFVPFETRTATPTGRESSHGLGLSIAHEIVRLHRGEIRVESSPGHGATFFVDLPFA